MIKYDELRDTNQDWLGKIPINWGLSRVGNFFKERTDKVDDLTYPPLSVTMSGIVEQLSNVAKTSDSGNRKLVKKNDFVINSRSDRKGSSGISPRDGSVSLINTVLEPKGIESQYIEYLFKSYYFKEEYFRNGKGIHWDLWTTKWEKFKNIKIPVPTIEDQKLISNYLNNQTERIDSLIEKIQQKIALLKEKKISSRNKYVTQGLNADVKMKDSNVAWIKKVPKHWKIIRLSNLGQFRKGKNITKSDLINDGLPVILYSHIYTTYSRIVSNPSFFINKDLANQSTKISKNTFLFTSSGESKEDIGKCLLFVGDSTYVGGDTIIFDLDSNLDLDPEFLSFSFNSSYCVNQKSSNSRGDIVVHLYEKQLREIFIPIPPLNEQVEISSRLKKLENDTNVILSRLESKINLLKEYRQALIFSAVTGKIKVSEDMK